MRDEIRTKHQRLTGDIVACPITFRASEDTKEKLMDKAADENLTLSSYINLVLTDMIDESE